MAEPTGTLMPTSYDSSLVLLGNLIDQKNFELAESMTNSQTTITTGANLSDIELPVYLLFSDNKELVFAEGKSGSQFTSVTRGVRGTTAATHNSGTQIQLILSGVHFNMLRDAVIAGEKFQGLVGVDASKPATPLQNQVYFATDTLKMYVCLTAGSWTWVGNRDDHVDLSSLSADNHTQYHNDTRAGTWHTGLGGGHVTDGNTHTHVVGAGAGRVVSGTNASKPATPSAAGEVYYSTDLKEFWVAKGTLGTDWVKIVGAPSGAIAAFSQATITALGGACPPGWVRYTALDDRLPKGAPTGVTTPLNTGGASTHTHTYTTIPTHTHSVSAQAATVSSVGDHSHSLPEQGSGAGSALGVAPNQSTATLGEDTDVQGSHAHTFTFAQHDTASTKKTSDNTDGVVTGTTGTASNWPPYQEVYWCQKS